MHYNLGVVHQLQGDAGAAGVAYREAARLDPDYARTQATDEDSTAKRTAEAPKASIRCPAPCPDKPKATQGDD